MHCPCKNTITWSLNFASTCLKSSLIQYRRGPLKGCCLPELSKHLCRVHRQYKSQGAKSLQNSLPKKKSKGAPSAAATISREPLFCLVIWMKRSCSYDFQQIWVCENGRISCPRVSSNCGECSRDLISNRHVCLMSLKLLQKQFCFIEYALKSIFTRCTLKSCVVVARPRAYDLESFEDR